MSSTGRRVVITGANRGLGLELVRQCLARGDTLWSGCRSPASALELQALGTSRVLPLDVSSPTSITAFAQAVAKEADGLDLLINNAGVNATAFGADVTRCGVLDLDPAHFLAQMEVNALGPMLLTRALLPLLARPETSTVANISSQLGSLARAGGSHRDIGYNASKAALNMITVALAGSLAAQDMIVVTIHPGWVRTDMGGPQGELSAETSAQGVLSTIDRLSPADNGTFLQWDGTPHAW